MWKTWCFGLKNSGQFFVKSLYNTVELGNSVFFPFKKHLELMGVA